jgi:hypothetical protein
MTQRQPASPAGLFDIAALSALAWVAAAALHEGLGHGVACSMTGGMPENWSTFHFGCAQQALSAASRRIVAGAGTAVNVVLMALSWMWWRTSSTARGRIAAWIVFVINGLTSFGYLVFSAAFDIGDWNSAGVLAEIAPSQVFRGVLAVVGALGYYAVIRVAAAMLSPSLDGPGYVRDARRLSVIVWATTGIVSLLAAAMSGPDWRSTVGASIGVALGGNAGLLSVARFVTASQAARSSVIDPSYSLRLTAIVAVAAFVTILGPGVALR